MRRGNAIVIVALLLALPPLWAASLAFSFARRNQISGEIVSSGERREYLLHVPPRSRRATPAPLVISLHGAGGWPAQQMRVSGWNDLADEEGFLVVYPAAASRREPRVWRPGRADDVRFLAGLIDQLEARYDIDRRRIYVDGLSNGGGMAFALSCALSGRIAAVGLVAAAQTMPWSRCGDDHAVPVVVFHGTSDRVVPYDGGTSWLAPQPFPSIPRFTANWARRNGCAPQPREWPLARDVSRREYVGCSDGASVVLYTIAGGGHTWPGGGALPAWLTGRTTRSINATREMWRFFRAHPRRSAAAREAASRPPSAR